MLGDGVKIEQLAEGRCAMDCQRFTLSPGAGSRGQYSHEGEEFIHVLSGRFEITLDGRQRYQLDRKSTRLNSSHTVISYAVFCLKKKTTAKSNIRCRRR